MSSPGSSSSVFSSLPARPPTPPKDLSSEADDALRFLQEGHQVTDATAPGAAVTRPPLSTDTPPSRSPASSQIRGSGNTKKVDFSPWPTYHKIPHLGQSSSPQTRAQRQTPLSRATKPLKSILKPAIDRLPLTPDELGDSKLSYFSPQEPGSFRKMLQSVLHQLESTSREARRDAYLALNGALKAYDGVPEPQAIVEKIKPLMQFITRDMAWKDTTGRLDSNIVTQALTLTCAIMFNADTLSALDDDFRSFLLDRSIFVLEQADIPKAIFKSHMFLMCQQRFSNSIMTGARAEKLITALQTAEIRCTGNSVHSARMLLYTRLIEQAPGTMLSRMREWIEHVFHGVLSSSTDLRNRAIETCTAAALTLGSHQQASKVLYEVCEKEVEDGKTYGDYVNLRLMQMTGDKEQAEFVPQIWSAVIMFFRCKRKPVEKWPKFRTWLVTIQKSLNSGDLAVKQQANMAWNRLVFAVMPDSTTTETMRSMLKVPILVGLEKKGNDKHSQHLRQFALDSYCNLLHYALRPELSHEELDLAWEMYVSPVLPKMSHSGSRGQLNTCRTLHGLLKRNGGVWNSNAVNEAEAIKLEDLPRLDPRWVRSRIGKVIAVLEPLVISGMLKSPKHNEHIDGSWRLLMQAVAEAGSQEVKASNELKEAIAQLTNFFRRIWSASAEPQAHKDSSAWFSRYQSLLQLTVEAIGSGHFVEDILHKTSTDDVEAAPTPSHRPSKHHAPTYSPFVFLFALYYQPPPALQIDNCYGESVAWFLRLVPSAKGSACGILALLHRAVQFGSQSQGREDLAEIQGLVWNAVADRAVEVLQKQSSTTPYHDANSTGVALRSALNIFIDGLSEASSSPACMNKTIELYTAACRCASYHAGNGGIVLGVMEPLSKLLVETTDDTPVAVMLRVAGEILNQGIWPKNRQELDRSRKALWVISLELPKGSSFDPFDSVYKLLDLALERAYNEGENLCEDETQLCSKSFAILVEFLQRCPVPVIPTALRRLQHSLSTWIADKDRVVFQLPQSGMDNNSTPHKLTSTELEGFWTSILGLLRNIIRKDTPLLQSLDELMVAGFSSPSKAIVNCTIDFWNESFGNETLLVYPPRLQPVLRARREQTNLLLPGFPEDYSDMDIAILPAFTESQSAPAIPPFAFGPAPRGTRQTRRQQPAENTLIKQHLAAHGLPYDAVAVMGSSSPLPTPAKLKAKSKLRHEDSQIAFAPIESSLPSSSNQESQLLTERQQEVKARQRGDAQMFPDLSSSPAPKSTASKKSIAKKLDFTSDREPSESGDINVTPSGPTDGNPMSDDLLSSPTPRASATVRDADEVDELDEDAYETDCGPPSSPPKHEQQVPQTQQAADETTEVAHVDSSTVITEVSDTGVANLGNEESSEDTTPKRTHRVAESDLPSDTPLPTAQLQREAAAAESQSALRDDLAPVEDTNDIDASSNDQRTPQTPSRIEETVLSVKTDQTPNTANTATPKSQSGSKKRKRNSEIVYASKKRKQSPFKTFFTGLLGRSQEPDEEMEDEIVVASSQGPERQPSPDPQPEAANQEVSSPVVPDHGKKRWSPQVLVSPPAQSLAESSQQQESQEEQVTAPSQEIEVPRKRGRPRKKKPHSSEASAAPPPATAGVKRPASDIPLTSSTSRVEDTPAPPKTRKQRRAEHAALAASQNDSQVADAASVASEHEQASAERQLANEQSVANVHGRKIAKPSSLMGKLRGALAECKRMILGTDEEERAIDDIMFEIRREVFEARRRGRTEV